VSFVRYTAEHGAMLQSCPWVGLTHGLGWVRSGWVEVFQILLGWVGSNLYLKIVVRTLHNLTALHISILHIVTASNIY